MSRRRAGVPLDWLPAAPAAAQPVRLSDVVADAAAKAAVLQRKLSAGGVTTGDNNAKAADQIAARVMAVIDNDPEISNQELSERFGCDPRSIRRYRRRPRRH